MKSPTAQFEEEFWFNLHTRSAAKSATKTWSPEATTYKDDI
jgi:hypothetical protein